MEKLFVQILLGSSQPVVSSPAHSVITFPCVRTGTSSHILTFVFVYSLFCLSPEIRREKISFHKSKCTKTSPSSVVLQRARVARVQGWTWLWFLCLQCYYGPFSHWRWEVPAAAYRSGNGFPLISPPAFDVETARPNLFFWGAIDWKLVSTFSSRPSPSANPLNPDYYGIVWLGRVKQACESHSFYSVLFLSKKEKWVTLTFPLWNTGGRG